MAYNKNELVHKIQSLSELSNEEKSALLELLRTHKKYGLVWEDKPEDVEERLRSELPVLKEVKERAIISDDPDAPNHILIEGDNFEALVALTYTHAGKVDVIYIDPPYNTGNNDFVYNDKYVEAEDSFKHSKWLSFMSRRLRIAKSLLSENGVIFISIDDHEVAALKLLCDEIFTNFVGMLPRVTKKSGKAHSETIANNHDYVLIYSCLPNISFRGVQADVEGFSNEDEFVDTRGKYKLNQTLDYNSLWYNPAMDFPIEVNGVTYFPGGSESAHIDRHNGIHNPKDWVWRWSMSKFEFGLKNGFVVFKKGRNGTRIYTKTYLNASIEKDSAGNYYVDYKDRETKMSSLALVENEFSNDNAKKELGKYIDANAFDFPKPSSLVSQLLYLSSSTKSVVLDFFAGSGTTLHATIAKNAEDGGKRSCILVTNNENKICEDVTFVRCQRVIQSIETDTSSRNNLHYFKTDFVGRERTSKNMRELMYTSTELLCIKNDLYVEVKELSGNKLNAKIARFFDDGKKRMLVVYQEEAIPAIAELIASMDYPGRMLVYVFSPGNYPYEDEFIEVLDKVELCALPAAIYNAYRKVLPKKKVVKLPEAEDGDENVTTAITEEENPSGVEGQLNLNFGE